MVRTAFALALAGAATFARADCPALLDHEVRVLRKSDIVNLCDRYAGQPLLVVNTASHCGYAPQLQGLAASRSTCTPRRT